MWVIDLAIAIIGIFFLICLVFFAIHMYFETQIWLIRKRNIAKLEKMERERPPIRRMRTIPQFNLLLQQQLQLMAENLPPINSTEIEEPPGEVSLRYDLTKKR